MERKEKKNDKKKLLVIILFLFAVFGFVGFGVYSYYSTTGSFDTDNDSSEDNVIRIDDSFNPKVDGALSNNSGAGAFFLGDGGTLYLTCPENSGGHETITCTSSLTVINDGSTTIDLEVLDASSDVDVSSSVNATAEEPTFSWDSTSLSSNDRTTLNVSLKVNVGSSSEVSDDTEEEVYAPVESGSLTASVSFRLKATQRN